METPSCLKVRLFLDSSFFLRDSSTDSLDLTASPLIPETHFLLGQLFKDAGLPDGCLNILQFDNEDVGKMVDSVIGDPRVRVSSSLAFLPAQRLTRLSSLFLQMVNFTGSEAIGKVIGESCGRHVK